MADDIERLRRAVDFIIDGDFVYDASGNLVGTLSAQLIDGSCSACGRIVGAKLPTHRCGEAKFVGSPEQAARDCNFTVSLIAQAEGGQKQ